MNVLHNNVRQAVATLAVIFLCSIPAWGAPVDINVAKQCATNFLLSEGLIKETDTVSLYSVNIPSAKTDFPCFYIFNTGDFGFVIASADDRCTPILGYSTSGRFDTERCPSNMRVWLENYAHDITAGILAQASDDPESLAEWDKLKTAATASSSPKADEFLLESTWEQGWGYNNYCPTMGGQHVVVGCVATAMAQIIRFHGYPHRGFGKKSYQHSVYGIQAVDFDTTNYDYTLMPNHIGYGSTASQRDMVSRLCYHCGVVVNMQYQHSGHPDGSGSYTHLVPDGLKYFGYTDAIYYSRSSITDDTEWRKMIRNEINNRRPIEYAGVDSEQGGHAFVLDGYSSGNRFHFNWGWGGYGDGFYTLNTMRGFTSSQEMVINIHPSGWEGSLARFHVSPDGNGDGTSWQQTNSNLDAAITLSAMVDRDIWMREGTYYGDTTAPFAYTINAKTNIYGGFAGTETSFDQRDHRAHPTIIDGMGRHGVLQSIGGGSSLKQINLNGLVLQNGYSANGNTVELRNATSARYITIRNCTSDSGGHVLYLYDGLARSFVIENNQAPVVCWIEGSSMRQSLINNNRGTAASLQYGRIVNSDIVSNAGLGVAVGLRSSILNSIIWNNDTSLRLNADLADTTLRHCAFGPDIDTSLLDSTSLVLDSMNGHPQGPGFVNPTSLRGLTALDEVDWHLARGSRCINAGKRTQESIRDGDMDGSIRCRQSFIDLGCYETNYPLSVPQTATGSLAVYPNPATTAVTLTGLDGTDVDLFDMTGRLLLHQSSCHASCTLELSSLPQGVYLIKTAGQAIKLIKK